MHLVLLETSGNQRYIFATNKLRDNMGASELTRRAGTDFVLDAVKEVGGPDLSAERDRRTALRDHRKTPPCALPAGVEIVLATSGKAMILTATRQTAEKIVEGATRRALVQAPGVDLCGVVSEAFDWTETPIHSIVREVHTAIEEVRCARPGPELRFQRLPIVTDCPTSGLPAESLHGKEALSLVSRAKRDAAHAASKRIAEISRRNGLDIDFLSSIDLLESPGSDDGNWLGVVHADGNGLGEIFLQFDVRARAQGAAKNREYVDALRAFSVALEIATEEAFTDAVKAVTPSGDRITAEVVPLVLGGDDLTVAVKGALSLAFTKAFLDAFEDRTAGSEGGVLARIAGTERLTACAGVAIVKAHFPFFSAYHLAEQLLQSAKAVQREVRKDGNAWPCSAVDFHVLYDSSGADLRTIRAKMKVDGEETLLYARPYIVTSDDRLGPTKDVAWIRPRRWDALYRRAKALAAREGDRRKLPNSQMHDLRAGLFLGHEQADARLGLVFERYREAGLSTVVPEADKPTLFESSGDVRVTGFLDALEAMPFLGKEIPE